MNYMTKEEIDQFSAGGLKPRFPEDLAAPLKNFLQYHGQYSNEQIAGRNFPIACIALEITQKCNLDCTLCYLSDLSQAVKDVPMEEIKRRIKMIHDHYGDHTNIQITGGDPTLRKTSELVEIVKEIKSYKMRAALFTNGILASREMLVALAEAGLDDIAFHVDLTQERKGFKSERELNEVRLKYINRAKDLPIRILFNTTVFDQNVHEIPELVRFFSSQADKLNLVSFQMQADTGRGVLRERDAHLITQQGMMEIIQEGVGQKLSFDMPQIGHSDCNKYTSIWKSGDQVTPIYDDKVFFNKLFDTISKYKSDWNSEKYVLPKIIGSSLLSVSLLKGGISYLFRKFWALKKGILTGNKVHRLSFFIHNFMDAEKLERERCESCVFMVATGDGPLSMCVHNAKRDEMISKKVVIPSEDGVTPAKEWLPIEEEEKAKIYAQSSELPQHKFKGRLKSKKGVKSTETFG